ncbi:isocitrate lyase/phosphoenolpyruvate mutase family protein [Actinoplanes sp. NBRC 103695]|uniref:isocitrate lyase/PEP mutase family protein n=1 Tax=Actinoplanes sp. NBRC 103695 TaxID=3032202 RepID=UPI0024A2DFEC|nr:isocitrate lyase/phosphoenolpyruvate mutase family protein [Actinoplanes sp. NBRC 103695]GLZ00656.1 2-methylisocitrate lyase [Actinoplanes sp. NBRC 103695]
MISETRRVFSDLHRDGTFVLPNPFDAGSARLLQSLGAKAVATTSSGLAATLGRSDQTVTVDELIAHVRALTGAVSVPVAVDAERGYAETPAGVAVTVEALARTGASGVSIEDYDPVADAIESVEAAAARIAAAAEVCAKHGMVLTGRSENHLYGVVDLDDTIVRLRAYAEAGAGCVYAPGLTDLDDIRRLVGAVGVPVNVLALHGGPSVPELAAAGVRRVSTGGGLTWAAYAGLAAAATELFERGTLEAGVNPTAFSED